MKPFTILILSLCLFTSLSVEGIDPYQQKPADVQAFQYAAYQKILNSPKPVYDNCQPFYKRVFYNIDNVPSAYNKTIERTINDAEVQGYKTLNLQGSADKQPELPVDMFIYFNTNISCPKSYVSIQIFGTKIFRFNCEQEMLHMQPNGTQWTQYVHRCRVFVPLDKASFVDSFRYTIYSQAVNLEDPNLFKQLSPVEILKEKKKLRMSETIEIELVRKQITTKMIVLGDWAPIFVRPYLPIHESLFHLIDLRRQQKAAFPLKNEYRFTAMVIAGDIAYNLEDYNCMKYNWFMSELEKVSPYWPIILFPGNHDDVSPGNRYLQTHSFEIGRLAVEDGNYTRVKWMRFPQLVNFVMFDPFWQIYNKATPEQTAQMTDYLQATLNQIQAKYPNEFTIAMSHYPIACSQMDDNHCYAMTLTPATKSLLDFMSTQRNGKPRPVDMYVGSHMHQFERVFPYANGTFEIGEKSNYARGHMVSVVEGAAGCDYGIISNDFPRKDFSVSATYFKTGYALMTIYGTADLQDKTKYILNYLHVAALKAPAFMENIDEFTIWGELPKKDSVKELWGKVNEKVEGFSWLIDELGNKLEEMLESE